MVSVKESAHSTSALMKLFKRIVRYAKHPKGLLWFFVTMNMVPSLCLVFTEPLSVIGRIILLLMPLGIYLLLFAAFKRNGIMQLILIPLLIFHAFQLVLFYLYGESVIAADMFLNLPTTNVSEAGELLNSLWPAIIIVCVLYIPTIILAGMATHYKVRLPSKFRHRLLVVGCALCIISLGLITVEKSSNKDYNVRDDLYPVNIFYNLYYAVNKWEKSMNYPVTSKEFTFHAHRDTAHTNREIYVLVIGEASRATNWELCGYGRPTNPHLREQENLILFKDAITQSNTTHKSVPLILSAADACHYERLYTQKSIVTAFKEAGFKTVFLSNQIPNRSFTDYFASEADVLINVRTPQEGGLLTINNYDQAMIPLMKHCIDSLSGNLFIVFHTYGSHFNYRERYPEGFGTFQPDNATEIEIKNKQELINAYDNSILYTDYFLHELIQELEQTQSDAVLLYSPDHGEDLLDDSRKKFLHASPNPTYYQLHIPMLLWFSEPFKAARPGYFEAAMANCNSPVATNVIFHTLLDLAQIQTPLWDSTCSIVNPGFQTRPRMYLNDHDQPVNYYHMGLKKQDREMIAKQRMDHREK